MHRLRNFSKRDSLEDFLIITVCISSGLALRLTLFPHETSDYYNFLSPWYDHLREHGFAGFKVGFSDYTPPYLYLLWLASHLAIPKIDAIKAISVIFDFALALVVLLLVRLKYDRRPIWLAAFVAVLFAPTIFVNSALWGQCDAIYTTFLLAALYSLLRDRADGALLFFSIALAFKLQAVFLVPLFFVLWAKGELALKYFLLIPAVYVVLCAPALIAGRPLPDLLTIYLHQANTYPRLTSSAPNLYQWLPDNPNLFGRAGLLLAITVIATVCYACLKSNVRWEKNLTVRLSLASALLVPFVLPYMHARYFYPADCIAIVYGFYFPRRFYVPLAVVMVSLFSYFPFLFHDMTVIPLPYLALVLATVLLIVLVDLFKDLAASEKTAHLAK